MAQDLLSVQASTVASESAFSLSGRVLSIRRTRLTLASLEMCIFLKDHLDAQERIQHTSNLKGDCLEIEQQLHEVEAEAGYVINIANEEIILEEQAMSVSGSDSGDSE
ncbi:zinc finger BED domain-containing protein RICESLEEPER 2 [Tanacetum coccineum]